MTSLSTTAYTPLEQLLLFQALRHEGTSNGDTISFSFNRISEELKAIPLVRNDPAYDADRLGPDALRQLYLWLLKEEVRRDLQPHGENETGLAITNGDASLATRKRKAPSPPLPTVQEAAKHSYLIPQLVSRLYATYRTKAVKELREHECQYDVLAREVGDGAASTGDGGPQPAQDTAQSPKPSSFAHTQPAAQRPDLAQFSKPSAALTLSRQENGEANAEAPAKRYSQAKIDAVINHGPEPQNGFSGHRRTSSNTTLPPLSEMAPQSPHFGIPPKMPAAVAPGMQPYLQHQYAHSPSNMHHPPYGPPHAHPAPGSQIQASLSRPSSSPRPTLPLPPGMQLQHPPPQHAGSPIMRGSNLPQQHYQPRHRPSVGPPPAHAYSPQLQISPDYYQSQPYLDRRISYQAPQPPPPPRYPVPPSHQGAYPLQPWPVDGSQQSRPPLKPQPTTQVQHFGQQPPAPLHVQRTPSRGTVKDEPSTPAESFEAFEHIAEPSATPASGPMTRKRRGTLQSQPQPRPKRTRQQSLAATLDADPRTPPPRPTTILATRNFNKMASTIMNDTTSHKHASYFAGPVRDRDASGYSEIIKQPQHLKSIRAAIAAGTRAIAAATSSLNSPAATPTAAAAKAAEGSTIELERSVDLIPPKAIVNGAQLEKEVYRMFANAVMFNPGEDGLVADTREMFEDVEAKIREWRGAEREAGQEEEAVEESKGKRRKL
ncbi:hypothetical protein B0A54_10195 [Friedmanniomyces endolithicus]|uniref:Bromo domain-containing protein n=1 Tax=Friedmanniomyces endolithicus TaxID=329885 RepID=A0A4U0UXA8_9PEZI|nr:hypothetical protein B0A54_10195 [Friedmanniomyces endolithicus]